MTQRLDFLDAMKQQAIEDLEDTIGKTNSDKDSFYGLWINVQNQENRVLMNRARNLVEKAIKLLHQVDPMDEIRD